MHNQHKKLSEKLINICDKQTGYKKQIVLKTFALPNGLVETFFVDKGKDSVEIFAITNDKKIIVVKQFRAGNEKEQIELPGGGVEDQEDVLEAAKRELKEETGYVGEEMIQLASVPYSPYSEGKRHLFMAYNCRKISELDLDPNEILKVGLVELEKFKEMVRQAEIRGFETSMLALDRMKLL